MPFDPTLPVNNSLISSSELRDQLNGLKSIIDQNTSNAAVSLVNAEPKHFQSADASTGASDSKQD
jgi:hypothetical protein